MTPFSVGIIGLIALFVLLFSRMPIAFVMGLTGFVGFAYLKGLDAGLGILGTVTYRTFADYGLSVIPLFILMGELCYHSGLSKDLYKAVHDLLGRVRGGLAMATVGACAGFACVSGSSVATAATMGTVALPEMKSYKYDPSLATGCVAAGGTLGILIPPSVGFIIYGIITEQSIGKLFLAGFIPGIIQASIYIFVIFLLCNLNPLLGLPGPGTSIMQKIVSLKNTWVVLLLFIVVIGGLYIGVFGVTEAAGIGAFGAFVFALGRRRLSWQAFKTSLVETGKTTAMIFTIILGAMILGYFLAVSRLPSELANYIGGLPVNRYVILGFIIVFYIFLGCIMEGLAMVLITVPIFFPLILTLGFDPIWFGVIVTMMGEIGLITPPVGLNVFVIQGVAKDVPMYTIFRGIFPFFIADLILVSLIVVFPQLALFLPKTMK